MRGCLLLRFIDVLEVVKCISCLFGYYAKGCLVVYPQLKYKNKYGSD